MKTQRHHSILSLVRRHRVESQEQLAALLAEAGIDVTQATLSRDLRALGVVKVPTPDGGQRYRATAQGPDMALARRNLAAFLREVVPAGNLLVIKTRIGGAQPVALALDQIGVAGVAGTIAGDDTVLAVVRDGHQPSQVMQAVWDLSDPAATDQ